MLGFRTPLGVAYQTLSSVDMHNTLSQQIRLQATRVPGCCSELFCFPMLVSVPWTYSHCRWSSDRSCQGKKILAWYSSVILKMFCCTMISNWVRFCCRWLHNNAYRPYPEPTYVCMFLDGKSLRFLVRNLPCGSLDADEKAKACTVFALGRGTSHPRYLIHQVVKVCYVPSCVPVTILTRNRANRVPAWSRIHSRNPCWKPQESQCL